MNNDFTKGLEIEIRRQDADFIDLMNDFEFVKELNKELSLKYQDFVDSLPKAHEIDFLIEKLEAEFNQEQTSENRNYLGKRIFQLKRFRSAAVILEKQDPEEKPAKFEELFGNGA